MPNSMRILNITMTWRKPPHQLENYKIHFGNDSIAKSERSFSIGVSPVGLSMIDLCVALEVSSQITYNFMVSDDKQET
jgi:hypothetical protein